MKIRLFVVLNLMLLTLLSACAPAAPATPKPTDAPLVAADNPTAVPESNGATAPEKTGPVLGDNGVPTDMPLPQDYYDLKVARNGTQITYKINAEVQTAVDFYHNQLEPLGWEIKGPLDSVVGNIATMLRQNEAGDRASINMQYNPNGSFTVITISINRK